MARRCCMLIVSCFVFELHASYFISTMKHMSYKRLQGTKAVLQASYIDHSRTLSTKLRMKRPVVATVVTVLLSVAAARVAPSGHVRHALRDEHLDSLWTKENRIEGDTIVPV
ncbi:uncharacterized protein TRIVIDRAFT_197368 [Trichoderma virens Gv29-8]|uniref:Uncharacterized protein n=1 Tax=Hypocrea virens (strain Gv29-8 / FGSC 10586) TaxID=413071 RepID=G9MGU8_HYPVG|nr:uncharacterized protein TRIVIDRAFT_197368 [Trichoderma virens Gv29-8]EHK25943.1 hypothetical protein TRIVIDRAFT_197368 [Trichoderma virens Gv29-8]